MISLETLNKILKTLDYQHIKLKLQTHESSCNKHRLLF